MQRSLPLLAALVLALASQSSAVAPIAPDHPGPVHPWTSLSVEPAADSFQFAIVSDRTGGMRPGVFEKAVQKLNLLQPQFVLSVGDLIEGGTDDPERASSQYDEFDSLVAKLRMPFFYVAGNHDIEDPACFTEWQRRFGRPYYSFTYRNVLFICLDSIHLDKDQADWTLQTLKNNHTARWTFVFLHYPLWTFGPQDKKAAHLLPHWETIERALATRPHTVFAGHDHNYVRCRRHGQNYYTLATTGGASWAADWPNEPSLGEFDHVVWVTMTDQGPRVANILLDGVHGDDVVTEETDRAVHALKHGLRTSGVTAGPIFIKSSQFKAGEFQATIENASPLPMRLWLAFDPHAQLTVEPAAAARHIPAQSKQLLAFRVTAAQPVDMTVDPLVLNTLCTFTADDGRLFTRQAAQRIPIVRRETKPCARAGQPVKIDGNLGDWDGLPFVVEQPAQILKNAKAWTGPEDCAYRFGVSFDLSNLYIAVAVTDDDVINSRGDEPWKQDGVEVRLDARPEPYRSMGRGNTDFAETVLAALVPVDRRNKQLGYRLAELPPGSQAACVKTKDGYAAEIAIPLSYVKKLQGEQWDMFRLNVAVNDLDNGETEGAQLHWVPDWRTPENYPASGTFQRVNP